tara:strand:- start:5330 stop:5668 length:339 start_codon:yes stop_codon:yes gene_type:complete
MGIRYDGRLKIKSSKLGNEEIFEPRGIEEAEHYATPEFKPLENQERYSLVNEHHLWKVGDHYWKLAHIYYGDSSMWWLIAWYNQKPTESHVKIGDSIAVPLPLSKALKLFYR